jgi:putative flippase GtrA
MISVSWAEVVRFVKYSSVGVSTFAFDMLLLFFFVELLHLDYRIAAGVAFFIAVSCNYFLSRIIVFSATERSLILGYCMFLGVIGASTLLTMGLMWLLVATFGLHYAVARVGVAGIVGIGTYCMNVLAVFRTKA